MSGDANRDRGAAAATGRDDSAGGGGLGFYPWYVAALMFLLYSSNAIDRQILSILLEPIKAEFGASDTMMGFLTGPAFALFYATAGIPIARWADRGSRKLVISLSAVLWSLLTALSGLAASFGQLALLRVGVGVGEAGGSPPAQSLLADYFPPDRRGRALGLFAAGGSTGAAFAFLLGGLLWSRVGWRGTLVIVGLPGVLLGALVWLTVREPERGRWERGTGVGPMPVRDALGFLWRQRSYVYVQAGVGLHAIASYGLAVWMIPFFMRVHGLELPQATTLLGVVSLVVGVPALIGAGWLVDRITSRDARWYLWVPTLGAILSAPFSVLFLFAPTPGGAMLGYVPHLLLNMTYAGPVFALTQAIVVPRARALGVAVHHLVQSLIGIGLGPLIVGFLNDVLASRLGDQAIRYTMLVAVSGNVLACVFYLLAARTVREDIEHMRRSA